MPKSIIVVKKSTNIMKVFIICLAVIVIGAGLLSGFFGESSENTDNTPSQTQSDSMF